MIAMSAQNVLDVRLLLQLIVIGGSILAATVKITNDVAVAQTDLTYLKLSVEKVERKLDALTERVNAVERKVD